MFIKITSNRKSASFKFLNKCAAFSVGLKCFENPGNLQK